ncbi:unnamed protein product [Rhizoctonia solani]|uniref:Nephrocystin 3-like N-terminal domain-containing protein n=1 Tax=Rhizoctonia solani TaxID=456999 RepID=A0A8H2W725_9AGAM|nr:unnamed protein product [Rhizoctonia solani]
MPFMMYLRDSLARSKDKWKRRPHWDSMDSASANLEPNASLLSTNPPESMTIASASAVNTHQVNNSSDLDSSSQVNASLERPQGRWSAIRILLATLESSISAFGPLKSAISGLKDCVDIYESNCNKRKEYDELGDRLEGILKDIANHMEQPIGPVMTNSVRRICSDLEDEARKVAEKQAMTTGRRMIDSLEGSNVILESYRLINNHLERLTQRNANICTLSAVNRQSMESRLTNMSPSKAAMYNSAESQDVKRGDCAPGTREPQIKLLLEWACTSEAGRTCWMNGMAGTGKTTIAHTVCSRLDEACTLGASFFCSRVIPECRQAKYIIPSIAYQLARFSVPFQRALDRVLELDPDAHNRTLGVQYKKLIVGPLLEVEKSLPADFIVVIDALDECENEDAVGQILDLILSPDEILPIRFLVSSRPEREITQRMSGRVNEQNEAQLVLHDLDSDSVRADIEAYMRYELRDVPLDNAQWSGIIASCGVLFIYASTTCRYIEEAYKTDTLDEAVGGVIGSFSNSVTSAGPNTIDQLYKTILTTAFNNPE